MALTAAAALVVAHWRGVWNQASRESGQGAKIGGAIVIGVIVVFLLPISVVLFHLARGTGGSLASSNDAGVLRFWTGEQALFAFFFPLFGGLRFRPAFPASRFGRFPVSRLQLLVAEIPASLVEVFPILGIGGIIVTNAALAVAMPRAMPAILVVATVSLCWFLASMMIASAAWSLLGRSRVATIVAVAAAFACAAWIGVQGIRSVFRGLKIAINVWLPALIDVLPVRRGYEGVVAVQHGAIGKGIALIGVYAAATVVLVVVAVVVHAKRISAEIESSGWRVGVRRSIRFDTPAAGIGSVYVRQLLGSGMGRTSVLVSGFMTASLSFVVGIVRAVKLEGGQLPEDVARTVERLDSIPWFALFPLFLVLAVGSQIWMNQFGFDASSLRGLLSLPIRPEQILAGKTSGLARFFSIVLGAGLLPVLAFTPPRFGTAIAGASVAVIAVMFAAGAGQTLSVRFPRSVFATASAGTLPLYLSWIPFAAFVALGLAVTAVHGMGELIIRGGGAALLVAAAAGSCLLYRAALPQLGTWMLDHRERLLTM